MPLGLSEMVFLMVQSMMTRKRMGERIHPCLTQDLTFNHSEGVITQDDTAFKVLIESPNQVDNLGWNSV